MGLDMYLEARKATYFEDGISVRALSALGAIVSPKISMTCEIGYWRKFDELHEFIVAEVQDGIDDCRSSYVSDANFEHIINFINDKIKYIPPGPLDWNSRNLLYSARVFDFASRLRGSWSIYYQASW